MSIKIRIILMCFSVSLSFPAISNILNECRIRVENVINENYERLERPKYVQAVKNILDKSKTIPVTIETVSLYNNDDLLAFQKIITPSLWSNLFKGETIINNFSLLPKLTFIIYPIKNLKLTHLNGFLILGYDEIKFSKKLQNSIELVETYLTQILEYCNLEVPNDQ